MNSSRYTLSSPARSPSRRTPKRESPAKSSSSVLWGIQGPTAALGSKGIASGTEICLPESVTRLLLYNNEIHDLAGFPDHSKLTYLDLSGNPLESIAGFPSFPELKTIKLEDTPFAKGFTYRTALLLAWPSLCMIDDTSVTAAERSFAASFPQECVALVQCGWCAAPIVPTPEEIVTIRRNLANRRPFRIPRSPLRA